MFLSCCLQTSEKITVLPFRELFNLFQYKANGFPMQITQSPFEYISSTQRTKTRRVEFMEAEIV